MNGTTAGTNGQHLSGYIPAGVKLLLNPRESAAGDLQKQAALQHTCKQHFNILASSLHDMYNNTYTHTGSAVARDTKDRSVRLHLPSTVKSQLGRNHHKMTIAKWNVRTLLDRETTNRLERHTALVAMERQAKR